MVRKLVAALLALFSMINSASSEGFYRLKAKGDYVHVATQTVFPQSFDHFDRKEIRSIDMTKEKLSVDFELRNEKNVMITVDVYPAFSATEQRLRSEFPEILETVDGNEFLWVPKPYIVSKDGYRCIGLMATNKGRHSAVSFLLFECGRYFLKFKASNKRDSSTAILDSILSVAIRQFSPIEIVKKTPVAQHEQIKIAPAAYGDSAILLALQAGAASKSKWIRQHVDSLERCAGYPGLYLEAHRASAQMMMGTWLRNRSSTKYPAFPDFLNLEEVMSSQFLDEYLMDLMNGALIVPSGTKLRQKEYFEWKEAVKLQLPDDYLYLVGYEDAPSKHEVDTN